MEDWKRTLVGVGISAVAIVLAAVLPGLLSREAKPRLPTAEDAAVLDTLRPLLTENQLINAEYAMLAEDDILKQHAEDVIPRFGDLLNRKQAVVGALRLVRPLSYYARVHQLLLESAESDVTLLDLQKGFVEKIEADAKVVDDVRVKRLALEKQLPTMTDAEKRTVALPALKALRERLLPLQAWRDKRIAATRIARASSVAAVGLLNQELRERKLPYEHVNVFETCDPLKLERP